MVLPDWFNLINSIFFVVFLCVMVSMILLRAVSRDVSGSYSQDLAHLFLLLSDFSIQCYGSERKDHPVTYPNSFHDYFFRKMFKRISVGSWSMGRCSAPQGIQ